ncbi:MAG: MarR family winged helix-turn-helix transcriptional regulator [Acidimicrobiales bacterium]
MTTPTTAPATGATTAPSATAVGTRQADDLAVELRLAVGRLSRRLRQHSVGGLSPSLVSAMASLDNHGPVPMGHLSRLEGVSAPTMTRIVDRLEQQGLVARAVDPADARSTMVDLSSAGAAALARLRHERTAFLARRLAGLDGDEVAALHAALPALRRLAEDTE